MKRTFIKMMGLLTLLASCSTETFEFKSSEKERVEVKFTGSIQTRVSGDTWEEGDEIGVFMFTGRTLGDSSIVENAFNSKYSFSAEGVFVPGTEWDRLYYPDSGSVSFIAYYPFGNVDNYKLAVDVSDQTFPADIDLLYSNNVSEATANEEAQNLVFEHQLSKVVFSVTPGEGYTADELRGMEISFKNVVTSAEFSLADGELLTATDLSDVDARVMEEGAGMRAEAIMVPQPCDDIKAVVTLRSGASFQYSFSVDDEWQEGLQFSYAVSLTKSTHTETTLEAEITAWQEGDASDVTLDEGNIPWDGTSIDTSWYSEAYEEMNIHTPEDLAGLAQLVNEGNSFKGKTLYLCNDLDMGNHAWSAIGFPGAKFSGTFNGQGHQVKNLQAALDTIYYAGLFGCSEGLIENVMVSGTCRLNSSNNALVYFGGICGQNRGVVRGCRNYVNMEALMSMSTDTIQTNIYLGGIVGENDGTVSNCQNYGTLQGENGNTGEKAYLHVGGIAGANTYKISDCENTRNLTAINSQVRMGGIVGLSTGDTAVVETCTNLGDITLPASHLEASVGGVIGKQAKSAVLKSSENKGNVSVTMTSGTKVYGGGLVAMNDSAYIQSGINKGDVSVTGSGNKDSAAASGGIVGYQIGHAEVHQASNYGIASATNASHCFAGGITGFNKTGTTEAYTYSCCANEGYPARWVGNATDSESLITDDEAAHE